MAWTAFIGEGCAFIVFFTAFIELLLAIGAKKPRQSKILILESQVAAALAHIHFYDSIQND